MISVAVVKANSTPDVEDYHICDRCCVTGSQDVISQILFVVAYGVGRTNIYVTYLTVVVSQRANMLYGCLLKLEFW